MTNKQEEPVWKYEYTWNELQKLVSEAGAVHQDWINKLKKENLELKQQLSKAYDEGFRDGEGNADHYITLED